MQEAQKCPMCNSDITVEILEKAIMDEVNSGRLGKSGSLLGTSTINDSPDKRSSQ